MLNRVIDYINVTTCTELNSKLVYKKAQNIAFGTNALRAVIIR